MDRNTFPDNSYSKYIHFPLYITLINVIFVKESNVCPSCLQHAHHALLLYMHIKLKIETYLLLVANRLELHKVQIINN